MALKLSAEAVNSARMILDNPLVMEIFDDMESEAVNSAINAKLTDTETPAAFLAEVRAIRKFRSNLSFVIAQGEDQLKRNKAAN